MRIKMRWDSIGSEDGFKIREFHKGCIYVVGETIADTLARYFVAKEKADVVKEPEAA